MNALVSSRTVPPRDAFLHLSALIGLYSCAIALIILGCGIVDHFFRITGEVDDLSAVRACIAILLVAFPLYLYLATRLRRDYAAEPRKERLPIRKSQIYLTLFSAGLAFSITLILLIYNYLEGEDFTLRFLLKAGIVMLVSAGVFAYYLLDIRTPVNEFRRASVIAAALACAAVIAGLAFGFYVAGPPKTAHVSGEAGHIELVNAMSTT